MQIRAPARYPRKLAVASQPPCANVSPTSCCISGRIGVNEKRPIPIALASASKPTVAARVAEGSDSFLFIAARLGLSNVLSYCIIWNELFSILEQALPMNLADLQVFKTIPEQGRVI